MEDAIKNYFCNLHDVTCNQKYGKDKILPYSFHLKAVASQMQLFKKYIPAGTMMGYAVLMGAYGHDAIEDARLTYNDIINLDFTNNQFASLSTDVEIKTINKIAADIIFGCTESTGKNRSERHDFAFFKRLLSNKYSVFVKLCDLIANIKYSLLENSSMYLTYKVEWNTIFKPSLLNTQIGIDNLPSYYELYPEMIDYIDALFQIPYQN